MRFSKYISIYILLLFISLSSCKIFQEEDKTNPTVNISIEGGNEISREVTIYLEIEDDSKIESVSIMIDDTTALTVETNFDTIQFDVTPFADESEHTLYAIVEDSEANIGESEKLDVVITEFPGWRIYDDIFEWLWLSPLAIDENGLIWIGSGWEYEGLFIFDPISNQITFLNNGNSNLQTNSITDIKVIDGSSVWIANDTHVIQYDLNLNSWNFIIDLPEADNSWTSAWALTIDKNNDLWIGSDVGVFYYVEDSLNKWFQWPELSTPRVWDITCTSDNTIFAGTDYSVFSIKDSNVINYDFFTQNNIGDIGTVTADNMGRVWASEEGYSSFVFSDNNWETTPLSGVITYQPLIITKSGLYVTQATRRGLVIGDGFQQWIYFDDLDSPFSEKSNRNVGGQEVLSSIIIAHKGIAEAPNGDIWMVAGGKLMRYRPSLSGSL